MSRHARSLAMASLIVLVAASSAGSATWAHGPTAAPAATVRPAQKVVEDIWAYAVGRHPTTHVYVPDPKDRGSSAGGVNRVRHLDVGVYKVVLPDLTVGSLNAGIAMVTPLSIRGNRMCGIGDFGWPTPPTPAEIFIDCFDRAGHPAESAFSATILDGQSGTGSSAYVWANEPTNPGYVPDPSYQYNSTGATNTVQRVSTGSYVVLLPDLGTSRGNVQLTMGWDQVAGKPSVCHVASWAVSSGDTVVDVLCRNLAGFLADSQFSLSFTRSQGLKGPGVGPVAYLDANMPSTASYTPIAARSFSSAGMAPHVQRMDKGRYVVTLPGMPNGGAAQVTAYGNGKAHCLLSSIRTSGSPQQIGVHCFNPHGDPADSEFGLSYQR